MLHIFGVLLKASVCPKVIKDIILCYLLEALALYFLLKYTPGINFLHLVQGMTSVPFPMEILN